MASNNFYVIAHAIAVPAGLRLVGSAWVARMSICMRPRIYGPPGSYVRLTDLRDALSSLPKKLRGLHLLADIKGTKIEYELTSPAADGFDETLWAWDDEAFAEALPLPADFDRAVLKSYFPDPVEPLYYSREGVWNALLGTSGRQPGLYTAATWASLQATKPGLVDLDKLEQAFNVLEGDLRRTERSSKAKLISRFQSKDLATSVYHDIKKAALFHLISEGSEGGQSSNAGAEVVHVSEADDGRVVEVSNQSGAKVLLPNELSVETGFGVTVCNREGVLVLEATGTAALRLIPLELSEAPTRHRLEFDKDHACKLRWDGKYWNVVKEDVDNEFHRCVGALDKYPELVKRIGLTWDVEIPIRDLASLPTSGIIQLKCARPDPAIHLVPLRTNFTSGNTDVADGIRIFSPASRTVLNGERHEKGFLSLFDCTVSQAELDMPVLSLVARLAGLASRTSSSGALALQGVHVPSEADHSELRSKSYAPEDTHQALPAIHEIGFELSNAAWARSHSEATKRSNELHGSSVTAITFALQDMASSSVASAPPPTPSDLYLEDLLLGYRYDVWDSKSGEWSSLMEREVRIVSDWQKRNVLKVQSEGVITPGETGESTVQGPGRGAALVANRVARSSSVGFRWPGYSPLTPKPYSSAAFPESVVASGLGLRAQVTAPEGSQKKLRFGRSYRFRARVADVAGNSWCVEDANKILDRDEELAKIALTEKVKSVRFRPISPPVLAEWGKEGPREVRAMVIRTSDKKNASPQSYAVYAPRVPFETMMWLGMTDGFRNVNEQIRFLKETEKRASSSDVHRKEGPPQAVEGDSFRADYLSLEDPDVDGVSWAFLPGHEAPKEAARGRFTLHYGAGLGHGDGQFVSTSFPTAKHPNGKRYAIKPFNIRLRSGKTRSSKVSGKWLEITLPPGESQQVLLGCQISSESLAHMGLLHLADGYNSSLEVQAKLSSANRENGPLLTRAGAN